VSWLTERFDGGDAPWASLCSYASRECGGIAEDEVDLRVVEVGYVEGMGTAIEALRSDWHSALRMHAASRELCQREFTPARMIQNTRAVLAEFGMLH